MFLMRRIFSIKDFYAMLRKIDFASLCRGTIIPCFERTL